MAYDSLSEWVTGSFSTASLGPTAVKPTGDNNPVKCSGFWFTGGSEYTKLILRRPDAGAEYFRLNLEPRVNGNKWIGVRFCFEDGLEILTTGSASDVSFTMLYYEPLI